ncbi:unnamed protein product [Arctogadus glacialis]
MSSKSTDSESSNSSSSEDKKRKKKGKGRKKASKMVKMEKTLQRARNPEQALARYKKILKYYKRLGTMSGAFRKVGVDRNTVVVNAPIAELSIAAPDQYKEALKTYTHSQGCQFVFRSGGDNNHKLECGLKSAGYPYVSYSFIQRCITICSTVYSQVLKILFEQ